MCGTHMGGMYVCVWCVCGVLHVCVGWCVCRVLCVCGVMCVCGVCVVCVCRLMCVYGFLAVASFCMWRGKEEKEAGMERPEWESGVCGALPLGNKRCPRPLSDLLGKRWEQWSGVNTEGWKAILLLINKN